MLPHVANDDCADSKQMSTSCFAILLNHDAVDDDMFQKGLSEDDCSLRIASAVIRIAAWNCKFCHRSMEGRISFVKNTQPACCDEQYTA